MYNMYVEGEKIETHLRVIVVMKIKITARMGYHCILSSFSVLYSFMYKGINWNTCQGKLDFALLYLQQNLAL